MVFLAIISAVAGGVLGFGAAGLGAAKVLTAVYGDRDGGMSMSGFFGFGPVGGVAGALLGAGLVLWFGGGSVRWGRGLVTGAGVIAGLGGLVLLASSQKPGPSYKYAIEFETEYPAIVVNALELPSTGAMWGAAGDAMNDQPISQFYNKKCEGDVCVLSGSVAAIGPLNDFRVTVALGEKRYRYPLGLPTKIAGPQDWTEWLSRDGSRMRWRIVEH